MAFEGTLEDLAIVDVLQLLHVSRKTGVLLVFGHDADAHIVLKDGCIVGCKHPSKTKNIGEVLVEMGAATNADIDRALRVQQEAGDSRRPLMATLIEMGQLEKKTGWKALESLIESTVVELVSWQKGNFVFELGEVASVDEFAHIPHDVDTDLSVDTQMALMEAVRILDERNREKAQPAGKAGPPVAVDGDSEEADETSSLASDVVGARSSDQPKSCENEGAAPAAADRIEAQLATSTAEDRQNDSDALDHILGERLGGDWRDLDTHHVILFSDDGLLKMSMRSICAEHNIDIFVTEIGKDIFERIAAWRHDEAPPILVCDIGHKTSGDSWHRQCIQVLDRCRRQHTEISILLLCQPRIECLSEGFSYGAAAVLPRPDPTLSRAGYVDEMRKLYVAIVSCMNATFQRRSVLAYRLGEARRRMGGLKDRIREVRFPDGPSQISLVVLRHVAEYVERCVLFLVRKNDLLALGGFGLDDNAETVSTAITRLRMPIDNTSLIAKTVDSGRFYCGDIGGDALLRSHLYKCIGEPANPQVVLVPLRTKEKTAAIIYGDFGRRENGLVETDPLEILADHAGMAFELALAERR